MRGFKRTDGTIARPFEVGDVVYAAGTSAILGDVIEAGTPNGAGEQELTITWRPTTTNEQANLEEERPETRDKHRSDGEIVLHATRLIEEAART